MPPMIKKQLSRRNFIATTSAALAVTSLRGVPVGDSESPSAKLAIMGGKKAVTHPAPKWNRWGDPERLRLNQTIDQKTLFYWKGPQTEALYERVRQHHPLKHLMNCSSGTAAIHIAVAAAGVGVGDEVITTPITDIGTVTGILFQQAVPVFADLERDTYNLDVRSVEAAITPRTRAIVAVHLMGNPCNLKALRALADKHNLVLIEDCAQAWGAKYQGAPVGTIGHIACFSLQNGKLVTSGDGGVVGSNDDRYGALLQPFGDKGGNRRLGGGYAKLEILATNYRMSEMQAAVASAQLERLEALAADRARMGDRLTSGLQNTPGLIVPRVRTGDRCSYWFYLFTLPEGKFSCTRREFAKAVVAEGVTAGAGYIPVPIYQAPVFQKHAFFAGRWPVKELGLTSMDYRKVQCPVAEYILDRSVLLRITDGMANEHIDQIAGAVRKVATYYAS